MDGRQQEQSPATGAVSVVLVEDHALLAELLTDLLTDAGMLVLATATTQGDGHRAVTTHRPHVAVIDNELPDGSGVDLCRSLSAEVPEVTLLLHTGSTSRLETAAALEAGAAAVVLKTLRGDTLLAAIQAHGQRQL
jgi:two-component system, NarL family, response regulator DevR